MQPLMEEFCGNSSITRACHMVAATDMPLDENFVLNKDLRIDVAEKGAIEIDNDLGWDDKKEETNDKTEL